MIERVKRMVATNKRTIISLEIMAKKYTKQNMVNKVFQSLVVRPFISPVKKYFLRRKYQHHADSRVLDWDWGSINFNRIALVNLLLGRIKDPSYLEIGCASDSLFNSVPCLNKIGVDPVSGGNVRKTSDDFFALNKERFNVVFIDGLHTYEQVRKDVINSIKVINDGGWIAVHDMLPRTWKEHHIPIIASGAWTGDVWKVAFELSKTDGIEFKILKIDHGVGVIKVLNRNTELKDFREELTFKEFDYYYENLTKLPIIEWGDAQDWLKS